MSDISVTVKEIPQEVIEEVMAAFRNGFDLLKPYLQALTTPDRKGLFKMADGSEPFTSKTADYAQTASQFVPGYMNVGMLNTGLAVYAQLTPFCNQFAEFASLSCDIRTIAGAQAIKEALKYYDVVQTAAENRVAGAKPIADDLKKRFARKKSKKATEAA